MAWYCVAEAESRSTTTIFLLSASELTAKQLQLLLGFLQTPDYRSELHTTTPLLVCKSSHHIVLASLQATACKVDALSCLLQSKENSNQAELLSDVLGTPKLSPKFFPKVRFRHCHKFWPIMLTLCPSKILICKVSDMYSRVCMLTAKAVV